MQKASQILQLVANVDELMTTLKTAPLKARVPKAFESFTVSMVFFLLLKKNTHKKKKNKAPVALEWYLSMLEEASSLYHSKVFGFQLWSPKSHSKMYFTTSFSSHMRSSSTILLSRSVEGCQHTNKIIYRIFWQKNIESWPNSQIVDRLEYPIGTPSKTNNVWTQKWRWMEDVFPFRRGDVQVPCEKFRGSTQ